MVSDRDSGAHYSIRQLTEDDVALYREIRLEGLKRYPASFGSSYETEAQQPVSWFKEQAGNAIIIGGFRDTALMGVAGIYLRPEPKLTHKCVLFGMYVRLEAQGSGLAKELAESVIERVKSSVEEILLTVAVSNIAAVKLYTNIGFIEYGMEPRSLKVGDEYHDQLMMRLPV